MHNTWRRSAIDIGLQSEEMTSLYSLRKTKGYLRTCPRRTMHFNAAFMLLNNAVANSQA